MQKQPFKIIEVPLSKFNDEAIPHHQRIFEQHKSAVLKLIASRQFTGLGKEIREKRHVIRQLKDLLYELDTLRTQVEDVDLDRFDNRTFASRRTISALIKDYGVLEKQANLLNDTQNELNENTENELPRYSCGGMRQADSSFADLRIEGSLPELKLETDENRLRQVESLQTDVEDIKEIFTDLNRMVVEQAENVDTIETNVEQTSEDVNAGLRNLSKASKLKTAAYPLTGAILGSLVGGPLGLIAGAKIGGIAALGCGIVGYTGGKFFKRCNDELPSPVQEHEIPEHEDETNVQNEELDRNVSFNVVHSCKDPEPPERADKKDQ